jgi:hypothetical protein
MGNLLGNAFDYVLCHIVGPCPTTIFNSQVLGESVHSSCRTDFLSLCNVSLMNQGMFRGHDRFQKPFPLWGAAAAGVKGRITRKHYAKRKQFLNVLWRFWAA